MNIQKYEQPKLELVAIDLTDILLTSGGGSEPETVGALDAGYDVALEAATWNEVWGE